MALVNGDMIKKHHVALFVRNKGSAEFIQIKKSTDNTITPNAETKEFDFIVDESPKTVVDKLKHTLSQPITMFKGEKDFDFFYKRFINQTVGEGATGEILIAFKGLGDDASIDGWLSDATFIIDSFNPVESVLTVNIELTGTTDIGKIVITDGTPVFTSSSQTNRAARVSVVNESDTPVQGATVTIGSTQKITNAQGLTDVYVLRVGETYTVVVLKAGYSTYAENITTGDIDDGVITVELEEEEA
ncbi:MAG TPA: carboxypeptidase-like regulatory domain-containing protein [bacterium]|nr:carboxypeptidase-like regulatory domain-containing protein [bacterium]